MRIPNSTLRDENIIQNAGYKPETQRFANVEQTVDGCLYAMETLKQIYNRFY